MHKIFFTLLILFLPLNVLAYPIKITYGVTVCYEAYELDRLLKVLSTRIDQEDEIIILRDMGNTNEAVTKVIRKYSKLFKDKINLKILQSSLNGNFAAFKNQLIKHASPDNYLFQIDADEFPSDQLLLNLKWYISLYPDVDLFWVPRVNRYLGLGGQEECIGKCDEYGREAFPDNQARILNLKNRRLIWKKRAHETIFNASKQFSFPSNKNGENWALIHIRHLDKVERNYGKNGIVTNIVGIPAYANGNYIPILNRLWLAIKKLCLNINS